MTHNDQTTHFLMGEGDAWFSRNQNKEGSIANAVDVRFIKTVLQPFAARIDSLLEIGCANGSKCHEIATHFDANGFGIDPSAAAINMANQLYPSQNWQVGVAHQLPYPDHSFQLVYFGFCLCWVDRIHLYRCIAEADRVLVSGGFLGIVDFQPQQPHRRPYQHADGLYTYKSHYEQLFTTTGLYTVIGKQSFSHHGPAFATDQHERIAVTMCYKEPDPYPLITPTNNTNT